jgi:hypothetical protein
MRLPDDHTTLRVTACVLLGELVVSLLLVNLCLLRVLRAIW